MKKACLVVLLATPLIAQAETTLGLIATKSQSPYKDTDAQFTVLPNISYEAEHFYLRFPEIGYRILPKQSVHSISVGLSYESAGLDPDDSNDTNIQLLDDRDASIMAFASYRLGPITTKIAQDVSGTHDGYYAQISTGYPIQMSAWRVIPSIAYRYMDNKMSNHLFGVSQTESNITGGAINTYNSDAVSFIRYGVRGIYPVSQHINLMVGLSHTHYADKILKSPIVEDNTVSSLFAAVTLRF